MAAEIVDRRNELMVLTAFLDRVPDGGQALLLEGDAGIGKTVLWQEALRLAGQYGYLVLRSRPTQSEAQVALAAVGDLLAPVERDMVQALPTVQRRALEAALLIREPDEMSPAPRVLGVALLSIAQALAERCPVLVAVDDVQWIDASSAAVLTFMLRRLEDAQVAVLATARGRSVEVPLELDRSFPEFQRFAVEPLSIGATHRMLAGRLSLNLPRPALMRVHETTGGNPFYALEIGRALMHGTIPMGSGPMALPASLQSVARARLGVLPQPVRDTLVAVAALAVPTMTLLESFGPDAVDHVEQARAGGVLELDGDRILFTHPLFAPACYSAMPLHRRRRVHARLAGLGVDLEQRARHLAIAATGQDESVATALDAAAAHAGARSAVQAAADLAERAVALTPDDELEGLNLRRITAAEYCRYAGDIKKSAALLDDVITSCRPGRVRADAITRLAQVRGMTEGFPVTVELLRRALAEPDLEPHQEVNLLCELAWLAHQGGDNHEGARYATAGRTLAEQLGDPATLALALAAVAQITFARTGTIRRDLLERGRRLELEVGETGFAAAGWWTWHAGLPMRLSPSRVTLALLLGRSDRYDESRALWEDLTAEARTRGDPDVVRCLFHRAQMEMTAGAWDTAARLCEEAIDLSRQIGLEVFELLCRSVLAEIDAGRGRTQIARRAIPDLLDVVETSRFRWAASCLRIALAQLELTRGDGAAAWRQLSPLLDGVEELDMYLARMAGSAGVEALLALDDVVRAERLLEQLDRHAARGDTAVRPLVLRCRGLLLASQGDLEQAITSLEAAGAAPEPPQEPNPFENARTLLALGTVQRRAQHKRAARESLQRAADAFEQLGARPWLDNARSELRRIGGRTTSDGQLSETERRIVELVVTGRRNSEVAAELHLSPYTVAWNLSKVYRKLGVSSRTELAARANGSPPSKSTSSRG
jgi:DNA-binding CsgD family transcriptional regulator